MRKANFVTGEIPVYRGGPDSFTFHITSRKASSAIASEIPVYHGGPDSFTFHTTSKRCKIAPLKSELIVRSSATKPKPEP